LRWRSQNEESTPTRAASSQTGHAGQQRDNRDRNCTRPGVDADRLHPGPRSTHPGGARSSPNHRVAVWTLEAPSAIRRKGRCSVLQRHVSRPAPTSIAADYHCRPHQFSDTNQRLMDQITALRTQSSGPLIGSRASVAASAASTQAPTFGPYRVRRDCYEQPVTHDKRCSRRHSCPCTRRRMRAAANTAGRSTRSAYGRPLFEPTPPRRRCGLKMT